MTWPGIENIAEYYWVDDEGNHHLKSIDEGMCEIIMSSNLLHFRVCYYHLLPSKKMEYVPIDQQNSYI